VPWVGVGRSGMGLGSSRSLLPGACRGTVSRGLPIEDRGPVQLGRHS